MKLSQSIDQFIEYCQLEKGKSKKTIENYSHYLGRFLNFTKNINVSEIDEKKIRTFRLHLLTHKNTHQESISQKTQNYHLIALRSFLKFLQKKDIPSFSPEKIELIKEKKEPPEFLEQEEIDQLLTTFKDAQDIQNLRDNAILQTLFSTGLRVSELIKLTKENLGFDRQEISVTGKGGKTRVVFLSDNCFQTIKRYLAIRKDINPYLFVSHHKKNQNTSVLTARSIQRIIRKTAKKAGLVKKVTPHTLRHSFATDLLINGADLRSVQSLLGHSSITTTQIYTHLTDKHLKEVHQKYHRQKNH